MYSANILGKIVTLKSQPDGRKFCGFKVVGTRSSDIIVHIYATTSCGLKMRIETVAGNSKKG